MSLTIIALLLLILVSALVIFYLWAGSGTLPTSKLPGIAEYDGPPGHTGPQEIFTVMTFNMGYLSGMTDNLPVKRPVKAFFDRNMETFLLLLREIQPDVIGFQEIDFNSRRSHWVDQLKTTAVKGGYKYGAPAVNWDKRYVPFPYWPVSVHFGRVLSGQAVLSRRSILAAEIFKLQKPMNKPFYYNALYLDRLVQVVKIKTGPGCLVILNVHLEAFHRETRENQAQMVLKIYRSFKDVFPVILMGDFNSVPPDAPRKKDFPDEPGTDFSNDRTMEFFLAEPGLKPAETTSLTFPADKPNRKLDYIFYTPAKIKLIEVFTPHIDSSDHLPVAMRFSFSGG